MEATAPRDTAVRRALVSIVAVSGGSGDAHSVLARLGAIADVGVLARRAVRFHGHRAPTGDRVARSGVMAPVRRGARARRPLAAARPAFVPIRARIGVATRRPVGGWSAENTRRASLAAFPITHEAAVTRNASLGAVARARVQA